jgi:hypothetical protein
VIVRRQFGDNLFDQATVVHLQLLLHAAFVGVLEDVERTATQALAG